MAATIGYNVIEAIVAITAGSIASSVALIGFGLDSTIEVLSAAAVAWQFTRRDPERWERGTLRVIAVAFFALAAYVTVSSLLALAGAVEPEHSTVGLDPHRRERGGHAAPVARRAPRRTGARLGDRGGATPSRR